MPFNFLCRQLVFVDEHKQLNHFKLVYHWDGRFSLVSISSISADKPFFLLIDTHLPYRRQVQLSLFNREMIVASGEGLFPDEEELLLFAMGEKAKHCYLFAMPQSDLDGFVEMLGKPEAVIVSDAGVDAMAISVINWYEKGEVCEFNGAAKLISPAKLFVFVLLLLLSGVGAWAFNQWDDFLEQQYQQEVAYVNEVKAEAEPLILKRSAISHMRGLLSAQKKLHALSAKNNLAEVMLLLNDLPENSYISDIRLIEDDGIELSGWGKGVEPWLISHKIDKSNYEINPFVNKEQFVVRFD